MAESCRRRSPSRISPSTSPPRFASTSISSSSLSFTPSASSVPSLLLRSQAPYALPSSSDLVATANLDALVSSIPSATPPLISSASATTLPSQALSSGGLGSSGPSSAPPNHGVVVIGAVGRVEEDVSQLLNRILDAQVFRSNTGNGNGDNEERTFTSSNVSNNQEGLATNFPFEVTDETLDVGSVEGYPTGKPVLFGERGEEDDKEAPSEDVRRKQRLIWMKRHLQHYYDEERGVVYVMFSWDSLPLECVKDKDLAPNGLSSLLEQREADGLRGLLFMFSVCHIVLFIQDGAHFEPKMLQVFRILQAAKHSLAPYVKMQVLPRLLPSPNARAQPLRPISLSTSNSPGRGVVGRQGSMIALMSGSAPTLFPGQCTPVLLFVCFEDFSDLTSDAMEVASFSSNSPAGNATQINPSVHGSRQVLPFKPPVQILMAKRPATKMEAGQRKKFQSSVEAQIRFLIKRCRIVVGSGDGGPLGSGVGPGMGPRASGGVGGSLPGVSGGGALFTLDPTRAVVFLERSANRCGEALDAVTDVVENIWRGEESTDPLLELSSSGIGGDEIQHLKDLLWRQADILRGKGGLSGSSTGGSVGVGMVAAAAAAAAASAAAGTSGSSTGAGKPVGSHPELPSLGSWLSASKMIVEALMTTEGKVEEGEKVSSACISGIRIMMKRAPLSATDLSKSASPVGASQSRGTVESALGYLESSKDLNMKFSASWCKKILPSALEVYLKGLPSCYPTALHIVHLQKALQAFQKMVGGPAVPPYSEKLKEDCEKVWKSGRQLCDAVSLTGKPCIYQVHEVPDSDKIELPNFTRESTSRVSADGIEKHIVKPHSSGIVFLHACACGRSRQLREDPFDYDCANVNFFQFPQCENMLPSLVLPEHFGHMPSRGVDWSLIRLGNARYYQPSLGLLQDGFCTKQNFLSRWFISLRCREEKGVGEINFPEKEDGYMNSTNLKGSTRLVRQNMLMHSSPKSRSISEKTDVKEHIVLPGRMTGTSSSEDAGSLFVRGSMYENKKASLSGELMVNFGEDSAFPPLPQRHERQSVTKVFKHLSVKNKKEMQQSVSGESAVANSQEGSKESAQNAGNFEISAINGSDIHIKPPLLSANDKLTGPTSQGLVASTKIETVYIGFEHECPYGHRFFLSFDQVKNLGGLYSQIQESMDAQNLESSQAFSKQEKVVGHRMDYLLFPDRQSLWPHVAGENLKIHLDEAFDSTSKLSEILQSFNISEGFGEGCALLGSNLPIYMKCPHCKASDGNIRKNGLAFAGTVSQLQRIFLVCVLTVVKGV
ncbi:hypothetical protein O6H91_02G102400 [Diphasiastrum complanatum]|uniref:Uncharacterized protein n=1 Tax=Diphasiastrum complanatum TaxID=34168 RepID=A0ACC2EIV8_DIPCM|nr:hypothetical protein O6H91_02G102400 [Diphasiastrum complanatum]